MDNLGGPNLITRVLVRGRQEDWRWREKMQGQEKVSEMTACDAAGFEDRERSHVPRSASGLYRPVLQARKGFSPRTSKGM